MKNGVLQYHQKLSRWEFWDVSWATDGARCPWPRWWTWWRPRWRRSRWLRRRSARGWSVLKILKTGNSPLFLETRKEHYTCKCSGLKRKMKRLLDLVWTTSPKQQLQQQQQQLLQLLHQKATILAAINFMKHQKNCGCKGHRSLGLLFEGVLYFLCYCLCLHANPKRWSIVEGCRREKARYMIFMTIGFCDTFKWNICRCACKREGGICDIHEFWTPASQIWFCEMQIKNIDIDPWMKVAEQRSFSVKMRVLQYLGNGTPDHRNEKWRPLFNTKYPLKPRKSHLRNHFWPLESVFLAIATYIMRIF